MRNHGHISKACKRAPKEGDKKVGSNGKNGAQGSIQRHRNAQDKIKGGGIKREERTSKAKQAMRLLEAARKERDKIQGRAEKRTNEYAAAARVVSELTENNGKGHKKARFHNEDDEEDNGIEQFEAPARGGNAPRKGKVNLAMTGGLIFVSVLVFNFTFFRFHGSYCCE